MTDEGSGNGQNDQNSGRQRANAEEALSESTVDSVEKGGEVTDPGNVPDDGYIMAPTRNNPDRGNGTGTGDGGDGE